MDNKKAEEIFQANRDLALMDSVPLCGLSLRPISIRTFVLLKQCGNKFIVGGGHPSPAEVGVFLWFHSPQYCLCEKMRRRFFRSIRQWFKVAKYLSALVEINTYLASAFMEAPKAIDEQIFNSSTVPEIMDLLAREYGWSDKDILDMPLARVFLYRTKILDRGISINK